MILLRVVHVGSAMAWFGGAMIGAFFLGPTAKALGREGSAFMDHLVTRRRMGVFFPIVATLTVLSGAALYWRDSGGFQLAWIASPTGLGFSLGAIAGITSLVLGFALVGPSIAAQTVVQKELAASGAPATPAQVETLALADRRMQLANRVDFPLVLLAGLMMAVARYL